MSTAAGAIVCFSLATLGVDMTLSPSWTSCQDLAGPRTGLLSGAMNMVGNLGSFVSSITFPVLLESTGSAGDLLLSGGSAQPRRDRLLVADSPAPRVTR